MKAKKSKGKPPATPPDTNPNKGAGKSDLALCHGKGKKKGGKGGVGSIGY